MTMLAAVVASARSAQTCYVRDYDPLCTAKSGWSSPVRRAESSPQSVSLTTSPHLLSLGPRTWTRGRDGGRRDGGRGGGREGGREGRKEGLEPRSVRRSCGGSESSSQHLFQELCNPRHSSSRALSLSWPSSTCAQIHMCIYIYIHTIKIIFLMKWNSSILHTFWKLLTAYYSEVMPDCGISKN